MGPSIVCEILCAPIGWLCGWSDGLGRSLVWLVARPCLVWMLLAVFRQAWSQVTVCGILGALGLVLADWWVESGSWSLWGCCPPTDR